MLKLHHRFNLQRFLLSTFLLPAFLPGGCARPTAAPIRLEVIPKTEAVRIVNANAALISGTLRAVGSVDGQFTNANGSRRSFHLDGVLFYLAPRNLRFDLKSLGERQLLLGSNAQGYWFYSAEDKRYRCGANLADLDLPDEIPVTPDQMIEALGLGGIPKSSDGVGPVQRIEEEFQQLVFITTSGRGEPVLEKEYWLDRASPRLIRRVLFRDAEGSIQMDSRLDDYQLLGASGPRLPQSMSAIWPENGSTLRFRINQWSLFPQIRPDSPQFATPQECGDGPS